RPGGWNGVGEGGILREAGVWRPEGGRTTRFHNVFRWTLLEQASVRLEHLRLGPSQPVYLFDLAPTGEGVWSSVGAHVCREDCYSAELRPNEGGFLLVWTITGPRKAESVEYPRLWRGDNDESAAGLEKGKEVTLRGQILAVDLNNPQASLQNCVLV